MKYEQRQNRVAENTLQFITQHVCNNTQNKAVKRFKKMWMMFQAFLRRDSECRQAEGGEKGWGFIHCGNITHLKDLK